MQGYPLWPPLVTREPPKVTFELDSEVNGLERERPGVLTTNMACIYFMGSIPLLILQFYFKLKILNPIAF